MKRVELGWCAEKHLQRVGYSFFAVPFFVPSWRRRVDTYARAYYLLFSYVKVVSEFIRGCVLERRDEMNEGAVRYPKSLSRS